MQITFDPHNQSEAEEVLALLKGDDWTKSIDVPAKVTEPKTVTAERVADKKETAVQAAKATTVPTTKPITKDDLVEAIKPLMTSKENRDAIKDLFADFGADSLGGVKETDYAELFEKVKELG